MIIKSDNISYLFLSVFIEHIFTHTQRWGEVGCTSFSHPHPQLSSPQEPLKKPYTI